MIDFRLGRYALGISVATALVAGCGGQASNAVVPSAAPDSSLPHHKTFNYTGGAQDFTVPAGVRHISVVARGASGAGFAAARGGRVHADIPVTPGERLVVYVGGDASGESGGFNGGADGGEGYAGGQAGFGGGGASDIRQHGVSLRHRVLVSGGGGGRGGGQPPYSGVGGKGGGLTGGTGGCAYGYTESRCYRFGGYGGYGGTQSAGGRGGGGGSCLTTSGSPGRERSTWHRR